MSTDGEYAHCTREERAGALALHDESASFAHRLTGECRCGVRHGTRGRTIVARRTWRVPHRTRDDVEHERTYYADGDKEYTWKVGGRYSHGDVRTEDIGLLGSDLLASLPDGATVVVVEGEPAWKACRRFGIAAVAVVTGAKTTPSDDALHPLLRFQVTPWPDADEDGRELMRRVSAALLRLGCRDIRLIDWKDAPDAGDAGDFAAMGSTRAEVDELLASASPFTSSPDGWETPTGLPDARSLPPFPVSALPTWLCEFVVAEAEATQTPVDMAALFALGAHAAVAGGHVEVEPRPGWREGVNLFLACAMESGSRKSAVYRDCVAPVLDYERELADAARPQVSEQESRRRIAEAARTRAEKAAANAEAGKRSALEAAAVKAAVDHALAAFGLMGAEGRLDDARLVQRWIVASRRLSFTRRECQRAYESRFPRSEDLSPAFELLEEHGWIRRAEREHRPGRPPERYEVNPLSLPTEPTKPTKTGLGGSSVGSVGSVAQSGDQLTHESGAQVSSEGPAPAGDYTATSGPHDDDPMLRAALDTIPGACVEDESQPSSPDSGANGRGV